MKAPEKIYIINHIDFSDRRVFNAFTEKDGDDIEYIHKDVVDNMLKIAEDHAYFAGSEAMREKMVEKAVEWLEKNANKYIDIKDGAMVFKKSLIQDIRKAMSDNIKNE